MKKRTEEEKTRDHERMEKCIYGMHLAKAQKAWVDENDASNEKFAKHLLTTSKTKNRAIAGTVTNENMEEFAIRIGADVDEMKVVNVHSILELIRYRFSEDEHRKSMLSGCALVFFCILTMITSNLGPTLMMFIFAALFLHYGRNFWNIDVKVEEKSKSMIFIDCSAIVAAIVLVVKICMI